MTTHLPRIRQPEERVLRDVAQKLAQELSPERIYLFGSYAYGCPGADSDVDLMIVLDDAGRITVDLLTRAYRCVRGTFVPFELHFRSRAKFDQRSAVGTCLEHDIVTKGRLLYAA